MLIYGVRRGSLAVILRFTWLVPLVFMFFPEVLTVEIPTAVSVKPIHVLVDDSNSMKENGWLTRSEDLLKQAQEECRRSGCTLKTTYLSKRSSLTNDGFSPINDVLSSWYYEISSDPWLIFTDGGDSQPRAGWNQSLLDMGKNDERNRGLVVGFKDNSLENVWLESSSDTIFSFEGKNVALSINLFRGPSDSDLPVQIQVSSGKKHLATTNVTFRGNEEQVQVDIPLPSLSRGNHFLSIEALPTATEKIIWDNKIHRNLEVMPNTIGMLHLLGSPSWDGRFVRRYLKSEPKYDLISFFILRDPVDHQLTNERELSLIPFPVDRLFNQELPNFRSVVLQNFSLYQFLEPAYQKNLVKFVKDGGGLLFIGGPRALKSSDYKSSALASILPFETEGSANGNSPINLLTPVPLGGDRSGPFYDSSLEFSIEAAKPDEKSRDLANVYDDWLHVLEDIEGTDKLSGIHHMENVKFKKGEYTPLLNAKLSDGTTIPLAVASYPGKGRALWLFSDSFWRLAMDPNISRKVYYDFLNSAMTWLLRQEFRKPISLQKLELKAEDSSTSFNVSVHGPAASYLSNKSSWTLDVCGYDVPFDSVLVTKFGSQSWKISGSITTVLQGGTVCNLQLKGKHSSFGSVLSRVGGQVPEVYEDQEVPFSSQGLESLSQLTKSELLMQGTSDSRIIEWVGEVTGSMGVSKPNERRSVTDYYWIFDSWWIYLLLLSLPLEVLVRRWPQLTHFRRI